MVLDERGAVLASSGTLHGGPAWPPAGVLDFVRSHGRERVTWQPERGVRIASVVVRVAAPRPGFVMAGRNLREAEERTRRSLQMCSFAAALLLAGTALLSLAGEILASGDPLGSV
jgi:hypothetical protein